MVTISTLTLQQVDAKIVETLQVTGEAESLMKQILNTKGKMIRPLLVLLSFQLCGGREEASAISGAAGVELIHLASLVHDDIIDESSLRRNQQTIYRSFGTKEAVLAGDLLFAAAFHFFAATNRPSVSQLMTNVIREMCQGEINQLLNPLTTEHAYWKYIYQKTACLMGGACALGALLADQREQQRNLQLFGEYLGIAFQLTDDVLDYTGRQQTLGKETGADFAAGQWTLPIILAQQRGLIPYDWHSLEFENVRSSLEQAGILAEVWLVAEDYIAKAQNILASFPPTPFQQELASLATGITNRKF